MDRKYGHRGYRDAEKQEKKEKSHDRKPPQSSPRGDQFGPRTPRMVGTVTRARCSNCGAVAPSQSRSASRRKTPRTTASSTNSAPPSKKTPLPLPTPSPRRLPRLLPPLPLPTPSPRRLPRLLPRRHAPTTPARLSRISSRSSRPRKLLLQHGFVPSKAAFELRQRLRQPNIVTQPRRVPAI